MVGRQVSVVMCGLLFGLMAAGAANAELRVRCEVDTRDARSKVSVDGKDLAAGTYRASVRSGTTTVYAQQDIAVVPPMDDAEFDFDSDPQNIAAGATPIGPRFIAVSEVGTAAISWALSQVTIATTPSGDTVESLDEIASGTAGCRVRD